MSSFFKEFREFAIKGNVVDLAVGIIIGAAFGKIVSSLVDDVIMPPIGLMLGQVDFSDLFLNLSGNDFASLAAARAAGAPVIAYGSFINTVINFAIVAFAVFLLVKQVNRLSGWPSRRSGGAAAAAQEVLLEEIRDLLKDKPAAPARKSRRNDERTERTPTDDHRRRRGPGEAERLLRVLPRRPLPAAPPALRRWLGSADAARGLRARPRRRRRALRSGQGPDGAHRAVPAGRLRRRGATGISRPTSRHGSSRSLPASSTRARRPNRWCVAKRSRRPAARSAS